MLISISRKTFQARTYLFLRTLHNENFNAHLISKPNILLKFGVEKLLEIQTITIIIFHQNSRHGWQYLRSRCFWVSITEFPYTPENVKVSWNGYHDDGMRNVFRKAKRLSYLLNDSINLLTCCEAGVGRGESQIIETTRKREKYIQKCVYVWLITHPCYHHKNSRSRRKNHVLLISHKG